MSSKEITDYEDPSGMQLDADELAQLVGEANAPTLVPTIPIETTTFGCSTRPNG